MRKLISIKSFILVLALMLVLNPIQNTQVSAATGDGAQTLAIEVEPVCSDAATGKAQWKVTNKNADPVSFQWTNLDNNATGNFTALNGQTTNVDCL